MTLASSLRESHAHSIEQLKTGVERIYGCKATWIRSQPARKEWFGNFATRGIVHLFEVAGFHRAKRIYVFNYNEFGIWYYTTMPEIPPVSDAPSAVAAGVARRRKGRRIVYDSRQSVSRTKT
jgi:hypothetical protein